MELLSIPKLQRCNRWSLGMDKQFNPTFYQACNYLYMLGLKLNHVSKKGPWDVNLYYQDRKGLITTSQKLQTRFCGDSLCCIYKIFFSLPAVRLNPYFQNCFTQAPARPYDTLCANHVPQKATGKIDQHGNIRKDKMRILGTMLVVFCSTKWNAFKEIVLFSFGKSNMSMPFTDCPNINSGGNIYQ